MLHVVCCTSRVACCVQRGIVWIECGAKPKPNLLDVADRLGVVRELRAADRRHPRRRARPDRRKRRTPRRIAARLRAALHALPAVPQMPHGVAFAAKGADGERSQWEDDAGATRHNVVQHGTTWCSSMLGPARQGDEAWAGLVNA